jgi:general secretion pathway protein A
VSAPDLPTSPQDPQYEAFYGLTEQPFAISTDPKFLFLSASHQRAYQELFTGLQRHEGLLLLTGEAGTGKTTLCRAVIDALGERTFSAILLNPYMSGAELLKVVLKEFGLVTREELRRGALARA